MLEKYTFMSKILFTQTFIYALRFKWFQVIYFFCFSKLVHVPHIYIYSIGPTPKSVEYQFFGQFRELSRQFSLDMSS
jgi:hypothetical protein